MFEAERGQGGRFLTKPKGIEQYTITSENAADMARRRWQKYREAAADAVAEEIGSIVPGVTTPEQAWGVLNARLASQIMDSDKPRGDDLTALGRNMGAVANAHERSEMENPPADAAAIVAATTELVKVLKSAMQPGDVIDVEATDTRNE